jgi:hypothetical protein
VATTNHPSGLAWVRWHWPFKTEAERRQIQQWAQRQTGEDLNDGSTPF